MHRLEVSGAVRPLYGSLGVKGLIHCEDVVVFDVFQVMSVGVVRSETSQCLTRIFNIPLEDPAVYIYPL